MASQNVRKPVLAGIGSAEVSDRGEAFDAADRRPLNVEDQAPRIASYKLTCDLLVEEVAYV